MANDMENMEFEIEIELEDDPKVSSVKSQETKPSKAQETKVQSSKVQNVKALNFEPMFPKPSDQVAKSRCFQVMVEDHKYRYAGVNEDMYSLKSLKFQDKPFIEDVPLLLCEPDFKKKIGPFDPNERPHQMAQSVEEFKARFFKAWPFMKNVNMKNIFIAGGSISAALTREEVRPNDHDVDCFVYGISDQELATERALKFLEDVEQELFNYPIDEETNNNNLGKPVLKKQKSTFSGKYYQGERSFFVRNGSTICYQNTTNKVGKSQIQVVLRLYSTMSEVLHGFDLGKELKICNFNF
jgi:hypothetical protein